MGKLFTIDMFRDFAERLIAADKKHDGLALQNLGVEIINTYQATTMTQQEYKVLSDMCDIMLGDWRRNYK